MMQHDHAEEDAAARERGIEHYAERLANGEFDDSAMGFGWIHDEWEERVLAGCIDEEEDHGSMLLAYVREGDIDGAWSLMQRVAREVVEEHYDRIMREAAEHAAEELADDDDS